MTRRPSTRTVLLVGAVLSLLVAGLLSGWASTSPDGLQQVAQTLGFADSERRSATSGSPLADYYAAPLGSGRLSGGLAGVLGVVVVGLVMVVLLAWLRPPRASDEER